MLLKNKTAIITGTRRGIGHAIVEAFAKEGANIWAHARKATPEFIEDMEQLSQKYNIQIRPLCFELTDYNAMKVAVTEIMASKIPIDILVNNAGITHTSLFQMSKIEDLREEFEVNFFSVFIFTQYISKLMTRKKSGSIINIASTAGIDANSGKSMYGSAKAAVICMTNVISEEIGTVGVRANCIAPGMTKTDMLDILNDKMLNELLDTTDLHRVGRPSEIADTAVFLASDLASYITGQVIRVDGGLG